jgi:mannose-1-phosphate guanylyltransferase
MKRNNLVTAILLSAGIGNLLMPYTQNLPKCLMPINGIPLLEIWLKKLYLARIKKVFINIHYRANDICEFLDRKFLFNWIEPLKEESLLGTAGTLRSNYEKFKGKTCLVIHSDNYSDCDLDIFVDFHREHRPKNCLITMMTFTTCLPNQCGIVNIDSLGIVRAFHEKSELKNGNIANAAIYLFEPIVLDWILQNPSVSDISTELLPKFIGKIATWHNPRTHIDIGTIENLKKAQTASFSHHKSLDSIFIKDSWSLKFQSHPIHIMLDEYFRK